MPQIKINGAADNIEADPQMPLLWAIRDIVGLTGTKFWVWCRRLRACTVHIDGQAVPPTAPAICNAIYAATGKRIRALPVDPQLLKA